MFTGLVETTGEIAALECASGGARLTIRAPALAGEARLGESVAVNGCCLTVAEFNAESLVFDLLQETLERTSLRGAAPGLPVNLERALSANSRLGGHFVQGHVDCTGEVIEFAPHGADYRLEVGIPAEFARYVAYKGAIAIDGVSLTVAEAHSASFVVWLIPHTLEITSLRRLQAGSRVNLEFDVLAKYVERILAATGSGPSVKIDASPAGH